MNINIEISDIVLDGVHFSESQVHELQQALQSELMTLVASCAQTGSVSHSVSFDGVHLASTANASPHEVASGLARSLGQTFEG